VFEWDPAKAARNEAKHDVSFEEAATVFRDPLAIEGADLAHSTQELRFLRIGTSSRNRVLVIAYAYKGEGNAQKIRIISARRARPQERAAYAAAN
jgi:uncharacterized DUF497 family protein